MPEDFSGPHPSQAEWAYMEQQRQMREQRAHAAWLAMTPEQRAEQERAQAQARADSEAKQAAGEAHHAAIRAAIEAIQDPIERLIVAGATYGNDRRFSHVEPLCPGWVPVRVFQAQELGHWFAVRAKRLGVSFDETRTITEDRKARFPKKGYVTVELGTARAWLLSHEWGKRRIFEDGRCVEYRLLPARPFNADFPIYLAAEVARRLELPVAGALLAK